MRKGDAVCDFGPTFGELAFRAPRTIYLARALDEVPKVLAGAVRAAREGRFVVGYLAYEAAPAFDRALRVREELKGPLAYFAAYDAPCRREEITAEEATLEALAPDISPADYRDKVAKLRAAIARGDYYQVSFTFRLRGRFAGDPLALYERLRAAQGGGLSCCLHMGERALVSASPELFFSLHGEEVTTRPMKGTARRGRFTAEDDEAARALGASAKDRAENVMIVDLLRNDLGRVARTGSVHVTRLFEVERWRTVWQLTSTVKAHTDPKAGLAELFAALFPCGSVTGAPKVAAMAAIAAYESSPRGAYCGAIGMICPDGRAVFNVGIRTAELDLARGRATIGVGGGITFDSTADAELDEAMAKGAFLHEMRQALGLIETIRLEGGRMPRLAAHLRRLADSARYFGIPFDGDATIAALARATAKGGDARVRLVLREHGELEIERAPLPAPLTEPPRICLAQEPVSRRDVRLFHKTTDRSIYEAAARAHPTAAARRRARRPTLRPAPVW